jgi:hypothetical protein
MKIDEVEPQPVKAVFDDVDVWLDSEPLTFGFAVALVY